MYKNMKNTKKARTVRALKELVLRNPGGVSRQEAADTLDIDLRTAAAYLEQLTADGLFRRECACSGRKGRPGAVYCSNADALCFLGMGIFQNLTVSAVVIDSAGHTLRKESMRLPENTTRLNVFSAIREFVCRFRKVENRRLYGIGLAISRWLQPPLSGGDTYANLTDYLERETGIAVHRDVNINTVAYACATEMHLRNLAVVHLGLVIEFGLVLNGEPERDFARREAWLSHMCVNPRGRRCYCGKYGCLENYVTHGALAERLKMQPNSPVIIQSLGAMLGLALTRMIQKFKVDTVIQISAEELFPEVANYVRRHAPEQTQLLLRSLNPSVEYGAALEAAHFELYRFTSQPMQPTLQNKERIV